jgi:hypothetical protein
LSRHVRVAVIFIQDLLGGIPDIDIRNALTTVIKITVVVGLGASPQRRATDLQGWGYLETVVGQR